MKQKTKIGITGGDKRQLITARRLADDGFDVSLFGVQLANGYGICREGIKCCGSLEETVQNADVILLPLPYSRDGKILNTSLPDASCKINHLLGLLNKNQLLLGGRLDHEFLEQAAAHSLQCIDYYESETLSLLNAIPTVEGAISLAIKETEYTLHGANVLVLGFGRIGKQLSRMLLALGANVCVVARKSKDRVKAQLLGCQSEPIESLGSYVGTYPLIFNTIPARILDTSILTKMTQDTLLIELASSPGGFAPDEATALGIRNLMALSLPAKTAPLTAGVYLYQTISEILTSCSVFPGKDPHK